MTGRKENSAMVGLRSLLFHILSGATTLVYLLAFPLILAPVRVGWPVFRSYIAVQLWLLRMICGLSYRVIGAENVPATPCILASRHEAMWETLFLPYLFDKPAVFLKQEILRYPIAGLIARRMDFIGIDRSGALDSIRVAFDQARQITEAGRKVLIFPSGTRDPVHRYRVQSGVAVLYRTLDLPCVPVVLDSGEYWILGRWLRRPGVITVRILPPIPPGLRTSDFLKRLSSDLAQPA